MRTRPDPASMVRRVRILYRLLTGLARLVVRSGRPKDPEVILHRRPGPARPDCRRACEVAPTELDRDARASLLISAPESML